MQENDSQEFRYTECQRKASSQQVPPEETDLATGKTYMVLPVDE